MKKLADYETFDYKTVTAEPVPYTWYDKKAGHSRTGIKKFYPKPSDDT
jgi:hypothetical protein